MHGMICVHKPTGMTSHDVVHRLRKIYQTKSVGHAGTLDPEASGLLICGINKGTRLLKFITELDKRYRFDVLFGESTDTLDHVGRITQVDPDFDPQTVLLDCRSFEGVYEQPTPLYSAVKVEGRKLYDYARKGETPPFIPSRTLTVHHLKPLQDWYTMDGRHAHSFEVHASHGIYVRQLAADIAKSLGTYGHTTRIERTAIGPFTLEDSFTLETLSDDSVRPLQQMVSSLKSVHLSTEEAHKVSHGQPLMLACKEARIALFYEQQLYAVYYYKDGLYKADVVLI